MLTRWGSINKTLLLYYTTGMNAEISSCFLLLLLKISVKSVHFSRYVFTQRKDHPYGDASKNMVLQHINQLKPIFHQYEKVITSIEAGFIGAWGNVVSVHCCYTLLIIRS